jgi:hypothetical protein
MTEFPEYADYLWTLFDDEENMPNQVQSILQSAVDATEFLSFCEGLQEAEHARIRSAKHPFSCLAFRSAIPDPRCVMSDHELRLTLRLRLGLPLDPITSTGTCPFCKDHVSLANNPQHPIDCIAFRGEDQRTRHNRLVNLVTSFCRQEANCSYVKPEIRLSASSAHRPDLFVTTYDGRSFWSDVMVTRPDSVTARTLASKEDCSAANAAARGKVTHYQALVAQHGGALDILPLCFEVYGAPSDSAKLVFKHMAASAEAGGFSSNCFASFPDLLQTSLSVCLQKGNAFVIASYVKKLAARRHDPSFVAAGSLLVSNHHNQ